MHQRRLWLSGHDGLQMIEAFGGAILANTVTFAFLHACWKLRKNENDRVAMATIAFIGLSVAVAGYALKYPN